MPSITRFEIKKLHGFKSFDIQVKDNTLILVGENGTGKTTVLHLFYYLLSGQWSALARYQFEALAITIDSKRHLLRFSDIRKSLDSLDRSVLGHLPPAIRQRILLLIEQSEDHLVSSELERLCESYGIPVGFLLRELELGGSSGKSKSAVIRQVLLEIRDSMQAQLLYLPTYRRIEQELSLIFKGWDERELKNRRGLIASQNRGDTYVELVEFGMKDVESAVNASRTELEKFARENLTNLTFSYLGDIVERQYESVELELIKNASDSAIDGILSRISEPILSSQSKQHLREIINEVKKHTNHTVRSKVICHYFIKLMGFQQELETREDKVVSFCAACNEYMVDKEFRYNSSSYGLAIVSLGEADKGREIQLQHLSSGEKQIVSLFSHLYLSGGTRYFVLIDEPELSLSVTWQRKFLEDIRNAGFCSGLVAVTHSPFIYDNSLRKYARGLGEFITV